MNMNAILRITAVGEQHVVSPLERAQQTTTQTHSLVEEANDLAADVLAASLLVIHDTLRGGQHDVTELTAGKEVASPHLDLVHLDIEAGRDAAALVQAADEVDDNLSRAMIVHNGNVTNVA